MADRKRPRRTRERILETALALFNRHGEPSVTTAHVADEMNISPGNLYYHFRNKDEIIGELYAAYESDVLPLFTVPPDRDIVVTRQKGEDFGDALREAFAAAVRRLEDSVRRHRGFVKTPSRPRRGRVAEIFPAKGFGFIEDQVADKP